MIAYKICKIINNKFYSSLAHSRGLDKENILQYSLGEWIYPPFGKIFVFLDLNTAVNFKEKFGDPAAILECEYVGEPKLSEYLADWMYFSSFKDFWAGQYDNLHFMTPPKGTYEVESVKPIRVL